MFEGCTSLTQAPELPATDLEESCYQSMFQVCANLAEAPELPATTLAERCHYATFSGCTKLRETPDLSAAELVSDGCYNRCYVGIIQDCPLVSTDDVVLPEFPAQIIQVMIDNYDLSEYEDALEEAMSELEEDDD